MPADPGPSGFRRFTRWAPAACAALAQLGRGAERNDAMECAVIDHARAVGEDGDHVGKARVPLDIVELVAPARVDALADGLVQTGEADEDLGLPLAQPLQRAIAVKRARFVDL